MEVQMARERAELARQRNDLSRLLEEIRHELQRADRDRVLTERLVHLRSQFQDLDAKGRSAPMPTYEPAPAIQQPAETPPPPTRQRPRDSGFLRRIFGKAEE